MEKREDIRIAEFVLLAALAFSPYAAQAQTPLRPGQVPVPFTDFTRNPEMNEDMLTQVQGWSSPKSYTLGVREPRIVHTKSGLPMRVEEPRDDSFGKGTRFYLSLGYSAYSSFMGEPMYSKFIDYPTNNDNHGTIGNPSVFSLGFGAASAFGTRIEINVSSLSGMRYAKDGMLAKKQICDPGPDWVDSDSYYITCDRSDYGISGGEIGSTNFSLNVYYDISPFLEEYLDHRIRPYVGGSIGLAFNRVDDYTVIDHTGYGLPPYFAPVTDGFSDANLPPEGFYGFYYADGMIQRFGMTTRSLSWGMEAGIGMDLSANTKLDLYWRRSDWGRVASGDELAANYYLIWTMYPEMESYGGKPVMNADDWPNCVDSAFEFNPATKWCEALPELETTLETGAAEVGRIIYQEIGLRLRLYF